MPKVSIITPFYKGEKYIGRAIESILNQNYKDFEYLIVDDGSKTNFNNYLTNKYGGKIIYIEKSNGGQASAVNVGIKKARGEFIAFCDQDDWYLDDKLLKQVNFLKSHPEIAMVYSDVLMGDENGKILDKTWMQSRKVRFCSGGYADCAAKLFKRNFIPAPLAVMIRKSIFDQIGLFNEKFSSAYDYDFWFRILEAGMRIGNMENKSAVWRTHSGQESRNIKKAKIMQIGILRSFLKRNPKFVLNHPFLTAYKIVKSYIALIFSLI